MKIGHWEYSDLDEWIDDKLEYHKPEYNPDWEEKKEDEGENQD